MTRQLKSHGVGCSTGDLIYEDYSTLGRLKSGNRGTWALLVFLGIIFVSVTMLLLFVAIFNPFSDIPQYARLVLAYGAIFVTNIILTCIFQKPIKIYRTGIDLGTLGSIGTGKALVFGIVYYFADTKYLPWANVKMIKASSNSRGAPVLAVSATDGKKHLCTLGDLSTSLSRVYEAVKRTEGKSLFQISSSLREKYNI